MKLKRKLIQIGDSLAVVIPKSVCELLGFKKGNYIEVKLAKEKE